MVQCSPLREATLSAYRATARFGAYHRAAYGGYYATKRYAQRASYLSPERLRPFRSGSMFSQASKGLRCKALENAVRLLYHHLGKIAAPPIYRIGGAAIFSTRLWSGWPGRSGRRRRGRPVDAAAAAWAEGREDEAAWEAAEGEALVLAAVAPDGRREDRETDDKGACGTVSWKGSFLYVAGGWAGFDRGNKAVHYQHMRAFHSGSRRQKTPRPAKRTGRPIILYIPECRWRRLSDRH